MEIYYYNLELKKDIKDKEMIKDIDDDIENWMMEDVITDLILMEVVKVHLCDICWIKNVILIILLTQSCLILSYSLIMSFLVSHS